MGTESGFTVFFDGRFWVGVFEIVEEGEVRAAKVVFGAEPNAAELWDFARTEAHRLIDDAYRAPGVPLRARPATRPPRNPKRLAREAANQQKDTYRTRSQEALAATRVENAKGKAVSRRKRRAQEAERRRSIRVAKQKAKRRGR